MESLHLLKKITVTGVHAVFCCKLCLFGHISFCPHAVGEWYCTVAVIFAEDYLAI